MAEIIKPRILKGFQDFLPPEEINRRDLIEKIESSFRSYGFVPIDTPALEYSEILLGKGGGETEKQLYRFNDQGGRDVTLRFDLTVPLARFLAEHRSKLNLPFKRYHIAKVWRGENAQRGRYREFMQCDVDILGSDTAACDYEILHMMRSTLLSISGGKVIIKFNHRGIFNRLLSRLGILDKSESILRTVDKLPKIGREATLDLLKEISGEAKNILDFIEIKGGFQETLAAMTEAAGPSPDSERLNLIHKYMLDGGIEDSFVLDPSITRGLDYYTGIVYESFLAELPDIGSVCSGGRYDNLVGLYSKETITGIGTSLGLDRLIAALEALGRQETRGTYARCAIACLDEKAGGAYQVLAQKLREKGIPCEVFLDEDKLTTQFQRAEKKGLLWLIIPDKEKPLESSLSLRDLKTRQNREGLNIDEIAGILG